MFTSNSSSAPSSSLLSALFSWWPDDFVHQLVQMSSSPPPTSNGGSSVDSGYAGPTLHFGEREFVVVGFWKIGSGLAIYWYFLCCIILSSYLCKLLYKFSWLVASMLVVALVAVLHEAVLGLRFFLEREQSLLLTTERRNGGGTAGGDEVQRRRRHSYVNSTGDNDADNSEQQRTKKSKRQMVREEMRDIFRRIFTRARMLQALLYFVQWSLFIFAFVLVPCSTFNFSLIIAALFGKTAGHLLFIHSPAMQNVERVAAPTPSTSGATTIQMMATRKQQIDSF